MYCLPSYRPRGEADVIVRVELWQVVEAVDI